MRFIFRMIMPAILFLLLSCDDRVVTRLYFDSGKLQYEYEINDKGAKDGFAKIYLEYGTLEYEGNYKNDLRCGWHLLYYRDGKVNQKILYENVNGREMVKRNLKYNKIGNLVSDFTFANKQVSFQIRNKKPYYLSDTLSAVLQIEDAKHTYGEATIGDFDEYLNVQRYRNEIPAFVPGNGNHEIVMRLRVTEAGPDTLTFLIRDFDYFQRTDSTGLPIGDESYFGYQIYVEEKVRV